MISDNQMEMFMKKVMDQLGVQEEDISKSNKKNPKDDKNKSKKPVLATSQIIVITALLANALDVTSFLVDKNQDVQVVLTGTLRRKSQLDKIMDQVGQHPFDEVMKAFMGRY